MNNIIDKELKSLVSLIDEPDENIYSMIEEKILSYEISIVPFLIDAKENNFQENVINRINNVLEKIRFKNVYNELINWKKIGFGNLLLGLTLIAQYRYPTLEIEKIKKEISTIRQDIWIELHQNMTALEKIKVFNHVFYDIYGYRGNKKDYHNPSNSFINDAIAKKTGNPIMLASIYMIIAQDLGLPVYGVNLPEHFVLAFINEGEENSISFVPRGKALFYVNAFNYGAVFTKNEIDLFLKQLNIKPEEKFYKTCSNIDIVERILNNLSHSYKIINDSKRQKEVEILIKGLED